jgi:hypothetical protein
MKNNYIDEKKAHKSTTSFVMRILIFFILIVIFLLARIAYRGASGGSLFDPAPTSDNTYEVAKQLMRPVIVASDVVFAEDGYQFGRRSDSVFVIRSYYVAKDKNERLKKYFRIVLKYNRKGNRDINNWTVLNIETE